MEDKQNSQNQMSSLVPILILGITTIILFQFLDFSQRTPSESKLTTPQKETNITRIDFSFQNQNLQIQEYIIENDRNVFVLSSKGGRVERVYLKSSESVNIPKVIIEQSQDPLEKQYNALEITRRKGMDFQLHLYKNQLGNPILNEAIFNTEVQNVDEKITQILFSKDIAFKDYKFTLYKIYRFLKEENFFHQIVILQNQTDRDFVLNGDLFYKPISALGPNPEDVESGRELAMFGRFYHYNGSLNTLFGFSPDTGFFGCFSPPPGKFEVHTQNPDTLRYVGVNSRYFISYAQFLETNEKLHLPDGVIIENYPPLDGSSTFSVVFSDFSLGKKEPEELRILKAFREGIIDKAGGYVELVRSDQKRKDVLIIDQIVYTGLRSDEEHRFFSQELARREFGLENVENSVRDVIYTSGFLALFSKLRDGIVLMMRFINKYVNNYGVTIIILALFFKLVTYPLNQVQAKTMKKIHELKPELDRINERYQDPAERQKKIMDLYKKHKINPAMGCLPILIQIPIFIALYSAFAESIELWKSPFIWWMKDLSQPDTVYVIKDLIIMKNFHVNILPLLMVGSQIIQQKMTMVSSDPQQKFLLYFMPILMLFFFWGLPSGVTLYWTVQNIISIIWQLIVEKFSKSA
ncbi:MAG: YidC/Oxa1 family membrane protein insertase [Leptospiraceae bacterium]|nr:YidC/Oxa1 family membrane protein insertase [Leptospiraceae bacterium]MDW7976241.1 YidC/Oxa1 family membrane protein insertase [Leptospiraceae bacterium]